MLNIFKAAHKTELDKDPERFITKKFFVLFDYGYKLTSEKKHGANRFIFTKDSISIIITHKDSSIDLMVSYGEGKTLSYKQILAGKLPNYFDNLSNADRMDKLGTVVSANIDEIESLQ